jgi:hypothetical protein
MLCCTLQQQCNPAVLGFDRASHLIFLPPAGCRPVQNFTGQTALTDGQNWYFRPMLPLKIVIYAGSAMPAAEPAGCFQHQPVHNLDRPKSKWCAPPLQALLGKLTRRP